MRMGNLMLDFSFMEMNEINNLNYFKIDYVMSLLEGFAYGRHHEVIKLLEILNI